MLLQATGIEKWIGEKVILGGVSLQIQERDRIGLVGANGAGKTTLMHILAGLSSYDKGELFIPKEVSIGHLSQTGGLDSKRSIWDELLTVFEPLLDMEQELRRLESQMADPGVLAQPDQYEKVMQRYARLSDHFRDEGGFAMEAKARGILSGMGFADVPPDTPVHTLSGGQKTRLAMAKLLLRSPDILMLDEPTNHLDIPTLTWLEGFLQSYPGAILVISHDRYFLDRLVHAIYEIERHECRRYTGNYSRFMELKAAEYETQLKHYEKQQEEIERMEDFVRRNLARASTTKRAQSRRRTLERMDRLDKPAGELKKAHFSFEIERMTGRDVLGVKELASGYGESTIFRHFSLFVTRGETVAMIGPNGIGKSTLLKTLTGDLAPMGGTVRWGTNVKLGYYDQEQAGLNEKHSVLEELWSEYPHMEEARIRTVLGNFLFSGEDVLKKISALSGGEKARVSLAKLMLKNANVLILDEPTNHLDLVSKEVLESALMDYEGTLIFISHDRYFLNKMAERIVELSADGAQYFLGNYDDYLDKKQELVEMDIDGGNNRNRSAQNAESGGAADYEAEKQAKREERNTQRRIAQLESEISEKEGNLSALEAELALPDVFNDYVQVQALTEKMDGIKVELQQLYAEWEKLLE